jgi:hypothetical protein
VAAPVVLADVRVALPGTLVDQLGIEAVLT